MSSERPQLYSGQRQFQHFCRMETFYPIRELTPAKTPYPFPQGPAFELPESFSFAGNHRDTQAFLESTDTAALLLLEDGKLRLEQYALTGGPEVPWTSWSVAKSFVSALLGIALEEGLLENIEDPMVRYLPELRGSGYEGASIRQVLQMSSGTAWNEDYSDPDSDVNRLGPILGGKGSLKEFVKGIRPGTQPDTVCRYSSADTQALGLLLAAVSGSSLTAYMQEKLCEPLGFEHRGYWICDGEGVELALGGLNLTARDYARIGELYRCAGLWQGEQLVPKTWVNASVRADRPHLQQGKVMVGGHIFPFGYGYQWWIPEGNQGEFSAIGVYNQFVFVNPSSRTVLVKLSANPRYGLSENEADNREEETVAFLRAVNAKISGRA